MMDNEAAPRLLGQRELLFLDFLGFSDAVKTWTDDRLGNLIATVEGLARQQSSFDVRGEAQADGGYKFNTSAELTTFSDHVVASYPFDGELVKEPYVQLWDDMVRQNMQRIAAHIVIFGLDVGLLVRGGVSPW